MFVSWKLLEEQAVGDGSRLAVDEAASQRLCAA